MLRAKKEGETMPMGEISSGKKTVMGKDIQSNTAKMSKKRCMIIGGISSVITLILIGAAFMALWAADLLTFISQLVSNPYFSVDCFF